MTACLMYIFMKNYNKYAHAFSCLKYKEHKYGLRNSTKYKQSKFKTERYKK